MRVLFDHPFPFALAHGGFQTQIEQTRKGLEAVGVEVEFLRWWDDAQRGNVIHFFGRPGRPYIDAAHAKGVKVVIGELLTQTGSRSRAALAAQKVFISVARKALPGSFTARLAWDAYQAADAAIANTRWEAELMEYLFGAPANKVHVVPNGVEQVFLDTASTQRGEWLVCTATITPRKRVLEVAEAAARARTPLWIIGKPYSEADPYAQRFLSVVAEAKGIVRYEGSVSDRARLAQIYSQARGFVLLSTMETLSLSSFEAAATGCPLLLSELPWAMSVFADRARYCRANASTAETASCLREFYDAAPTLPKPPRPATWPEIGLQFRRIYEAILSARK